MARMSKSVRRQLLACDLCQGALDSAASSFSAAGLEVPAEVQGILFRLQRAVDSASAFACPRVDAAGKWQLDAQETRQYATALAALQRSLARQFGPKVNAVRYVKAVQLWCEDVKASLPCHPPDRKLAWVEITTLLQELYLAYDEDMAADELIDKGMESGELFKQAAGCWA